MPDMESYKKIKILSTMSLTGKDKQILMHRMSNVRTLKLNRVLLDPAYNKKLILFSNVFSAACIMACRYHAILKFIMQSLSVNEDKYFLSCVRRAASKIALASNRTSTSKGNVSGIDINTAKYISFRAFIVVMRRDTVHGAIENQVRLAASRIFRKMGARDKMLARKISSALPAELKIASNPAMFILNLEAPTKRPNQREEMEEH